MQDSQCRAQDSAVHGSNRDGHGDARVVGTALLVLERTDFYGKVLVSQHLIFVWKSLLLLLKLL